MTLAEASTATASSMSADDVLHLVYHVAIAVLGALAVGQKILSALGQQKAADRVSSLQAQLGAVVRGVETYTRQNPPEDPEAPHPLKLTIATTAKAAAVEDELHATVQEIKGTTPAPPAPPATP